MTLDMMIANFQDENAKADDKQNLANKTDVKQDAKQDIDSRKQDFANKMTAIQEGTVNAAWKTFKETVEGLPEDALAKGDVEKTFKKCCDSAIAAMLLAAALMC